jgi:hypothetical protein
MEMSPSGQRQPFYRIFTGRLLSAANLPVSLDTRDRLSAAKSSLPRRSIVSSTNGLPIGRRDNSR